MGPAGKTRALSTVLAVAALATTIAAFEHGRSAAVSSPGMVVAVTVTFFLAEQFLVNIEFRRQSHSLTFAGVPLAVGILMLPVHELMLARILSALGALVLQRISADKIFYNTAAYAFEAAVVSSVVHLWLPIGAAIGLGQVALLVVCVNLGDQVMSLLVLWVIHLHTGSLSRRDVLDVLVPSAVLSTVATSSATAITLLLRTGSIGHVLVLLLAAMGIMIYRAYAATTRRHQSLQLVHDFVAAGVGAHTLHELGYRSLDQICSLLRAARADLLLGADDAERSDLLRRLSVTDEHIRSAGGQVLDTGDWVRAKAMHHGEATLAGSRSKDPAIVRWLAQEGFEDALVVPVLVEGEPVGVVTVSDRLGDTATFTDDDLTLLQTLTGHLAVAMRSTRLVERLSHDATHDSLTGLVNRAHLTGAIAGLDGRSGDSAVMLLDLDKFKEVNDVLGHDVGDRLLIVLAERLTECLPDTALIARLGGDEFAVLMRDLGSEPETTVLNWAELACAAIRRPVRLDEAVLTPEASIGIALADGEGRHSLLRNADTAMYVAKVSQENVVLYHPDMDQGRAERLALVADLRIALDQHSEQFVVVYQPKVDLVTGRPVSTEALVRWNHPSLGVVTPDRFIPLAETSGLIDRLTTHVLDQSLAQCATWLRAGHDVSVAVNLSARNLADAELPNRVDQALKRAGVPADKLIMEITESSVMEEPDQVLPILFRLTELGVAISLDDFGTGYSSLSYLQKLPVRELKIDRSFVTGLTGDTAGNARALIASIGALGRSLGLRIVSEGIETTEQQQLLAELGCELGQGYLFARPMAADRVIPWLDAHPEHPAAPLHLVTA